MIGGGGTYRPTCQNLYLSFKAIFNLWTFNLANQQITTDRRMKE